MHFTQKQKWLAEDVVGVEENTNNGGNTRLFKQLKTFKLFKMKKYFLFIYFSFLAFLVKAQQPGTLDKNFSDTGIAIIEFDNIYLSFVKSVVLKNDKIIVLSYYYDYNSNKGVALSRYLRDGVIDSSFASNGTIAIFNGMTSTCISIGEDDKIVVAGYKSKRTGGVGVALMRFMPNGEPDKEFGINGLVFDSTGRIESASALIIQPDGEIVITGVFSENINYPDNSLVKRYNNDGSVDLGFGNKGAFSFYESYMVPASIALQANGKIISAGYNEGYFGLFQLNKNGVLDSSFGRNGEVITDFDKYEDFITDIALQNDGKIVAAGQARANSFTADIIPYMAVARYNTNGSLDESFGAGGKTKAQFGYESQANAATIQKNGKIIVAGRASNNENNFALARFIDNGKPDSTFGNNGQVVTDIGTPAEQALSVSLQANGKIIAGGFLFNNNKYKTVLARYYGDPVQQLGPIAKRIRRWIRNNTLQWQPVNDNSIAYYSIQQSSNGVNNFKEISRIAAVNRQSSNVNNVYSYSLNNFPVNSQPSTVNYYRISAVSNNGSNITSDVIKDESISSITISPNPVKDIVKISGLPANQKSTVNIINRNGNVMQTAISNSSVYKMNISQLKSGIYSVVVTANGKMQTVKFVKE